MQPKPSNFKGGNLSSFLEVQLAHIYKQFIEVEDDSKALPIKVLSVQMQRGAKDCGGFVVAFAYHAARK